MFHKDEWVFEFDSTNPEYTKQCGYGPCAGIITDANLKPGPYVEWADGKNNGPLPRKNLVKAPAPGDVVQLWDGATYNIKEYTASGVTVVSRKRMSPQKAKSVAQKKPRRKKADNSKKPKNRSKVAKTPPAKVSRAMTETPPAKVSRGMLRVSANSPPTWDEVFCQVYDPTSYSHHIQVAETAKTKPAADAGGEKATADVGKKKPAADTRAEKATADAGKKPKPTKKSTAPTKPRRGSDAGPQH